MKIVNPGHVYLLENEGTEFPAQLVYFLNKKRIAESTELELVHDGTNNLEVLEMMVDRMEVLQERLPCGENTEVIMLLKQCSTLLYKRKLNRQSRGVSGKQEL